MRTLMLAALALSTSAVADPGGGDRDPGASHHRGPPPMALVVNQNADALGLSVETRDELTAMLGAEEPAARTLMDDVRSAHHAMRAAMEAGDADAAYQASARLGDAEQALRNQRIATDLAVRSMLTSDQLATLKELRPERPERPRSRPGR